MDQCDYFLLNPPSISIPKVHSSQSAIIYDVGLFLDLVFGEVQFESLKVITLKRTINIKMVRRYFFWFLVFVLVPLFIYST